MKTNWLARFLKRLQGIHPSAKGSVTATMPDPETIKQIVRGVATTRSDEIGCDECFDQVDQFAEMVLVGKNAAEALPLVQDHLTRCGDCREEFEALLETLRALT